MPAPQLEQLPVGEVDLLVLDNGSTDGTSDVIHRFSDAGLRLRFIATLNIGSDANFISAFQMARGTYFWLFSDDDIIVPGALDSVLTHLRRTEFDLIYATSYSFARTGGPNASGIRRMGAFTGSHRLPTWLA